MRFPAGCAGPYFCLKKARFKEYGKIRGMPETVRSFATTTTVPTAVLADCPTCMQTRALQGQVKYWQRCFTTAKQREETLRHAHKTLLRRMAEAEDASAASPDQSRELEVIRRNYKALKTSVRDEDNATIKALRAEVEDLKGQVRLLRHKRFGRKSEKSKGADKTGKEKPKSAKKKRGQRPGSTGHGRQEYEHLPEVVEVKDLSEAEKRCPCCGLDRIVMLSSEDSQQVEIEIKAHRRVIKRRKYRKACRCPGVPAVVTAPTTDKLIPKGSYGTSIWCQALLDKYYFQRPTHKFIQAMAAHGVRLPHGTLIGGFKQLSPLFDPVLTGIVEESRKEKNWHADETGWRVFEEIEGKKSQKWWLWVFRGKRTVVFKLDPTRSSAVPKGHFGVEATGIINADRFSAYKSLKKDGRFVIAYCWAHVRRDFVDLLQWPGLKSWAMNWIDRIGRLYALNDVRLHALESGDVAAFEKAQHDLRYGLYQFAAYFTLQLMCEAFDPRQLKVLSSLEAHWDGLLLFLDHSEISMDNNAGEREIRGLVVGRKNYYGAVAVWSGELCAKLYSILRTMVLWRINPQSWLSGYLSACAAAGGRAPPDATAWLPWNMTETRRHELGCLHTGPPLRRS